MQQIRHNTFGSAAPALPNEREQKQRETGGKESAANINQMMAAQIITHFCNAYQSQLLPEVATLIVGLNSLHLLCLEKSCDKNDKWFYECSSRETLLNPQLIDSLTLTSKLKKNKMNHTKLAVYR